MSKIDAIVEEETQEFFKEMIDPNFGGMYEPEGLDLKHVRLFEDEDEELGYE